VTEIELNARVLTEKHNIYVVRPGSDCPLLPQIVDEQLLRLDRSAQPSRQVGR
jgi:hypothetical protein